MLLEKDNQHLIMSEQGAIGDTIAETRSHSSSSSRRSSRSTASMEAARARAKAEEARTCASYATKEADMMVEKACIEEEEKNSVAAATRRKAELQASLHALQHEKEAAAALAQAETWEAALEMDDGEHHSQINLQMAPQNPAQRTNDYVESHSRLHSSQQRLRNRYQNQLRRSFHIR